MRVQSSLISKLRNMHILNESLKSETLMESWLVSFYEENYPFEIGDTIDARIHYGTNELFFVKNVMFLNLYPMA